MSTEDNDIAVAQVVPWLAARAGGTSAIVVNLARALERVGVATTIFTTDMAVAAQADVLRRGVTMDDLPTGAESVRARFFPVRHPYRLAYSPQLQQGLRSSIREFDVVHIHSLFLHPQYSAWREANRARVPWIVSPRGALDPYLRRRGRIRKRVTDILWQRRMLDRACALHLTSEEERRQIDDLDFAAPRVVIPNGLDTQRFHHPSHTNQYRTLWAGGAEGPLIMSHGRITEKKGLDILIRAFAIIKSEYPAAKLILVGPDDEGMIRKLSTLAYSLGVAQHLVFPGQLNGEDLVEAIAASDLWVLPSHGENFGTAVVEAMASAKPVLVSPHVNIAPEAASSGALAISENVAPSLAAAMGDLLAHPDKLHVLGQNARAYSRQFDWSTIAHQYRDLYLQARRES